MATIEMMPAPVTAPIPVARPLYAIEETLAAYLDTADLVPAEQEAEFEADLAAAMIAAVDKRDRVGQFMAHLDAQIEFADREIERLQERKAAYAAALDRMESYVIRTIESLGTDAKGKTKKLEGTTVTFSLRKCPASVDVIDPDQVPAEFKTASLRMPAGIWDEVLDALDLETRARVEDAASTPNLAVSRSAIKKAIDAGAVIPGADLKIGGFSLIRK